MSFMLSKPVAAARPTRAMPARVEPRLSVRVRADPKLDSQVDAVSASPSIAAYARGALPLQQSPAASRDAQRMPDSTSRAAARACILRLLTPPSPAPKLNQAIKEAEEICAGTGKDKDCAVRASELCETKRAMRPFSARGARRAHTLKPCSLLLLR